MMTKCVDGLTFSNITVVINNPTFHYKNHQSNYKGWIRLQRNLEAQMFPVGRATSGLRVWDSLSASGDQRCIPCMNTCQPVYGDAGLSSRNDLAGDEYVLYIFQKNNHYEGSAS